jgi:hypothetical protein
MAGLQTVLHTLPSSHSSIVKTEVTKLVAGMMANALFRHVCDAWRISSAFALALESVARAIKIETNALSSSLETWARCPGIEGEEAMATPTKVIRDFACRSKSSLLFR